ncbi:Sphingolipid C4-hydroxylase sur2 [Didymosphaeria variabile]|uniref:Sphingolipid C4-hydroxylase sur2 n=1 Tax=Didymosphaeria variabile TaxID=1932322 RepID=A0A9W9CFR1_9PLEO|nr:Sphingolipid C4-hydroxylase sur2 [Didymosphaeria variabile]KAJ4359882.1 Sphingolipid C4-hydroxylase sur2 [Didymosphaeria variabile]
MAAANTSYELPPLPEYTLKPLPPLFSWISDEALAAALPVVAYWAVSLIYHLIDVYDLFARYRLHTPAEVLKRNHVTRYEVFRDVIIQQVIQTIAALALSWWDEVAQIGKADYDIAWYAQKLRLAQRAVPVILSGVGFNSAALASKVAASQPALASILRGGPYASESIAPAFASWELAVASALYWYAIPALQFAAGIIIIDSWEYMLHRAMHMNKWLYVTFHSRHHRLYVPYAYGALYNHPFEGFLLDTLGAGLAYLITGMTVRQSWFFFSGSTIKTVLDHSGYAFPYDPLHWIFPNNAAYHDIHHQSWGIKTNFSQPFFTHWDRIGGTMYKGDVKEKYERARRTAEQKVAQEEENKLKASPAGPGPAVTSALETDENARPQQISAPRSTRRKASSISQSPADNFKGLRNKVNESLHGKRANVLGVESSH